MRGSEVPSLVPVHEQIVRCLVEMERGARVRPAEVELGLRAWGDAAPAAGWAEGDGVHYLCLDYNARTDRPVFGNIEVVDRFALKADFD